MQVVAEHDTEAVEVVKHVSTGGGGVGSPRPWVGR